MLRSKKNIWQKNCLSPEKNVKMLPKKKFITLATAAVRHSRSLATLIIIRFSAIFDIMGYAAAPVYMASLIYLSIAIFPANVIYTANGPIGKRRLVIVIQPIFTDKNIEIAIYQMATRIGTSPKLFAKEAG